MKKNTLQKTLALFLAGAMTLGLAACGGGSDKAADASPAKEEEPAKEETAPEQDSTEAEAETETEAEARLGGFCRERYPEGSRLRQRRGGSSHGK